MLTRIKNAYLARHQAVEIPYSKIKEKIAAILTKEGYIKKFKIQSAGRRTKSKIKKIVCGLQYKSGEPVLDDLKRISKPGRRVYVRWSKIPRSLSGYGITIVSTAKGLMVGQEAKKKKLGGEVICQVW